MGAIDKPAIDYETQLRKQLIHKQVLEMIAKRKAEQIKTIDHTEYLKSSPSNELYGKLIVENNRSEVKTKYESPRNSETDMLTALRTEDKKRLTQFKETRKSSSTYIDPINTKNLIENYAYDEIRKNQEIDSHINSNAKQNAISYESKDWKDMVEDLSKQFAHIKLLQLRSKFSSPPKPKPIPSPKTSVHDKCVLPSNTGSYEKSMKSVLILNGKNDNPYSPQKNYA